MRIAHKTVKEQMDAAERISATSRELELREQLAAEKARADALDAALNHARHELQAWIKNGDYSIDMGVALATERLQRDLAAEKARADKLEALRASDANCFEAMRERAERAEAEAKKWEEGWISPEDKAKVRGVLTDVLPRFGCPNCTNEYCAECDAVWKRINEGLALLDGKEAK